MNVSCFTAETPLGTSDNSRGILREAPVESLSSGESQAPSAAPESVAEYPRPVDVQSAPAENTEEPENTVSQNIIGEKTVYTVKKGDSLKKIGARTGLNWRLIARENRLNGSKRLTPGQKIVIDSRRIVPKSIQSGIVINIPDQTLYLFRENRPEKAFPVGLGRRLGKIPDMWRTPTGNFRIVGKQKDPAWHVPASIRKEMEEKNREVLETVPPGSNNPLGKYALRTSLPGIMIHGTLAPDSVYGFSSHGCIRMRADNIRELYKDVKVRTKGEIIYQPIKMAVTDEGRVYMEVHKDIYKRYKNLETEVKRLVEANNAETMVDWHKIKDSLKLKSGVLSDITLENSTQYTAKVTQ